MKNTTKKIVTSLFILAFSMSFAQIDFSSTRFGLIDGPTYSRIQNAHKPSSARVSFYGGFLALIPIGGDDMFYLQPEIEYLGAGENGQNSVSGSKASG